MTAGTGGAAARRAETAAPSARARAYARAQSHSRRVRWLKRVIPIGAAAAVSLVLFVSIVDPFGRLGIGGVSLGSISLSGTRLTMEAPRLTGYRKDNRAYEVTAAAATQDVRKPSIVELKEMNARMALDDKGTMARLTAKVGIFDTQKEQLDLRQDVHVRMDDGQEAFLRSAFVDFKGGTVTSKEDVTVKMTDGVIEAGSLEVSEGGKVVSFVGRVRASFNARAPEAGAAPAGAAPQAAAPPPASPQPALVQAAPPRSPQPARTSQAEPLSLRP